MYADFESNASSPPPSLLDRISSSNGGNSSNSKGEKDKRRSRGARKQKHTTPVSSPASAQPQGTSHQDLPQHSSVHPPLSSQGPVLNGRRSPVKHHNVHHNHHQRAVETPHLPPLEDSSLASVGGGDIYTSRWATKPAPTADVKQPLVEKATSLSSSGTKGNGAPASPISGIASTEAEGRDITEHSTSVSTSTQPKQDDPTLATFPSNLNCTPPLSSEPQQADSRAINEIDALLSRVRMAPSSSDSPAAVEGEEKKPPALGGKSRWDRSTSPVPELVPLTTAGEEGLDGRDLVAKSVDKTEEESVYQGDQTSSISSSLLTGACASSNSTISSA
ncbi:hypothetical protein T439DRAFT_17556 [Meredithblackwellia eburnea MCA 4105]